MGNNKTNYNKKPENLFIVVDYQLLLSVNPALKEKKNLFYLNVFVHDLQVITECEDEISARATELLREVSTCTGPALSPAHHHEAFLTQCCARTQRLQKEMDLAGKLTIYNIAFL